MSILQAESTDVILEDALRGRRIGPAEALRLYKEADFLKIQAAARAVRMRRDPEIVTYTVFQMINYTNVCNVHCSFCSFMREEGHDQAYVRSPEEIAERMRRGMEAGADQMFLQGGVHPGIPYDYYLKTLRLVKETLGGGVHIRAFSPVELLNMERMTGRPLDSVLRELKDAGLDSVPGAGAEILTDRMRNVLSPLKSPAAEWARCMEICHENGLPGSANIVFGSEETPEEIIEHLELVRGVQDRTGGFLSFIPWTFQPQTKKFKTRPVPTHEYLKVLGLCRLYLDNIPHIEASVMTLGPGVGSLALHSGADDTSSVILEENVLRNRGLASEQKLRDLISQSGFTPARRDLLYRRGY